MEHRCDVTDSGRSKGSERKSLCVTWSTTNPHCNILGLELGPRVGRVTTGQHESPHGPKSDDPICDLEREREERDLPIERSLQIATKLFYP